jgi:hypothetical protein
LVVRFLGKLGVGGYVPFIWGPHVDRLLRGLDMSVVFGCFWAQCLIGMDVVLRGRRVYKGNRAGQWNMVMVVECCVDERGLLK